MARKSLPSLFAQLDLTEFLVRVEEEGFVSPLDILELSDEEIKTFATEIGMKRGHIARYVLHYFYHTTVLFHSHIST